MEPDSKSPRTYSLRELEARSGFDKRTISYYISCGLLPKVGRRGPKTTYPQEFVDRLLLIRRVKELQDAGQLPSVTLSDIASVLLELEVGELAERLENQSQDDLIRTLFGDPNNVSIHDSFGSTGFSPGRADAAKGTGPRVGRSAPSPRMAAPGQRRNAMSRRHGSWSDVADSAPGDFDPMDTRFAMEAPDELPGSDEHDDVEAELTSLLTEVDYRARSRDPDERSASSETLLRVPITDDVLISVRNLNTEDAGLVERLAALLRRLTHRPKR